MKTKKSSYKCVTRSISNQPEEFEDNARRTRLLQGLLLPTTMLFGLLPRLRRTTAEKDSRKLTVCSIEDVRFGTLTLIEFEEATRWTSGGCFLASDLPRRRNTELIGWWDISLLCRILEDPRGGGAMPTAPWSPVFNAAVPVICSLTPPANDAGEMILSLDIGMAASPIKLLASAGVVCTMTVVLNCPTSWLEDSVSKFEDGATSSARSTVTRTSASDLLTSSGTSFCNATTPFGYQC